jgi:hypothetical protein
VPSQIPGWNGTEEVNILPTQFVSLSTLVITQFDSTPMNFSRQWISPFLFVCVLASAVFAAEASPAGVWKWTVQGRQGGSGFEQTVKLDYKNGTLTGIMPGRGTGQYSVPDTPISEASFKDGEVKFTVTREFNGQKFSTKYAGKLEGNTIKGTFEREGFRGKAPSKSEWIATRG